MFVQDIYDSFDIPELENHFRLPDLEWDEV